MPSPHAPRRLAAVCFADIVGYTSLSSRNEDGALQVVSAFQEITRSSTDAHGGRVVKFMGDGVLVEFPSTDSAVRAALALLDGFNQHDSVAQFGAELRIGIHVGEVIGSEDGDIYGDGVNLASRLQSEAAPGRIFISEYVRTQVQQRQVFETRSVGARTLKGFEHAVGVFEIGYAGALLEALEAPPAASTPAVRQGRQPYWPRSRAIAMGLAIALVAFGALFTWNAFNAAGPVSIEISSYRLTQLTFSGTASEPRFSPDGSSVAVLQDAGLYGGELLVFPSQGNGERSVAQGVGAFAWRDAEALVWADVGRGRTFAGLDSESADQVSETSWARFSVNPAESVVTRIEQGRRGSAVIEQSLAGDAVDTVLATSGGTRIRGGAWSPDGRWFAAAVTDAQGRASLRLYERETGTSSILLAQRIVSPRWHASGDAILFIRDLQSERGLYLLGVDSKDGASNGTVQGLITGVDIDGFDLAADGSIVYSQLRRRANIWSMSVSDGPTWAEATRGTAPISSPALDPTGQRLAFVRNGDLFVSDLAGQGERRVTDLREQISAVRWSPNGAYLAFIVQTPALRRVMIVDSAGGNPRPMDLANPLPYDLDAVLAWTGDGSAVVYVGADETGWPNVLARVDVTSAIDEDLLRRAEDDVTGAFLGAVASPDGTRIAVADASGGIQLVSLVGGPIVEIYPDTPGQPVLWTADGNIVIRSILDRRELRMVPVEGGPTTLLFELPEDCTALTLNHDASRSACTVLASFERDVWIGRPSGVN